MNPEHIHTYNLHRDMKGLDDIIHVKPMKDMSGEHGYVEHGDILYYPCFFDCIDGRLIKYFPGIGTLDMRRTDNHITYCIFSDDKYVYLFARTYGMYIRRYNPRKRTWKDLRINLPGIGEKNVYMVDKFMDHYVVEAIVLTGKYIYILDKFLNVISSINKEEYYCDNCYVYRNDLYFIAERNDSLIVMKYDIMTHSFNTVFDHYIGSKAEMTCACIYKDRLNIFNRGVCDRYVYSISMKTMTLLPDESEKYIFYDHEKSQYGAFNVIIHYDDGEIKRELYDGVIDDNKKYINTDLR